MRQYAKGVPGGLLLLISWQGSTLPRSSLFGAVAAVHGGLTEHFYAAFTRDLFVHTYPYHVLAFVTGFGLVFRLQLSMQVALPLLSLCRRQEPSPDSRCTTDRQRYWEARSTTQAMAAKWGDAAIQVLTFDEAAKGEAALYGPAFRAHIVHLFSMMHALAMDTLRGCMYREEHLLSGKGLDPTMMFQGSLRASKGVLPTNKLLREHLCRQPLYVLGDIDNREREALQSSSEHVHLVMTWWVFAITTGDFDWWVVEQY
jgi:hypothetical protein